MADTLSERRRNLYPAVSSDDGWLVFVSDRVERDTWDFYGLPIEGGLVNTALSQVTRLTTAGLVGLGPWTIIDRPLMTWNPSSRPVLAVVGDDDLLYFVETNSGGANTRPIQGITGDITELDWSADGQTLAVVASRVINEGEPSSSELFTIPIDGSPQLRHVSHAGDQIVDVTWSPDGEFIVYRAIRIDQSWFELIDIDGGTDFLASVVLSGRAPLGNRSSFADQMSTDCAYSPANVVYMLFFDGFSPKLSALDISGATQ
jgi:Tol biopolymer transport system component